MLKTIVVNDKKELVGYVINIDETNVAKMVEESNRKEEEQKLEKEKLIDRIVVLEKEIKELANEIKVLKGLE